MKIAILTTETPHHAFFVREIAAVDGDVSVFCESAVPPQPPFPTSHPFEIERDRYEWEAWFGGVPTRLERIAPTRTFPRLNDEAAGRVLAAWAPDVILVFGTAVLGAPVIAVRPDRILNLHGGDPERYRGLDTHLWAIYHREFCGLVTTLHRLDAGIDTGAIVLQAPVRLTPRMGLHALRRANTERCVELATAAIDMIRRTGGVEARPQRTRGRYYSAMPSVLKDVCKQRFEAYTAELADDSR